MSLLPEPQDIVIPPPSASLQLQRRITRRQRRQSPVEDTHQGALPGTGVMSGLQAMLTPTNATHPGGTIISHIGTSTVGPRIVIPLPGILATVASLSSSNLPPVTGTVASQPPLPSLAIDSEWFFLDAYPPELRQYLATSWSFDIRPRSPGETIALTTELLRNTYLSLSSMGLNITINKALKTLFEELILKEKGAAQVKHPYGESEATNTLYMVLAYVLSTLLWKADATKPLRNYPEPTYPGVIVASFVSRMAAYYHDITVKMGLASGAYLRAGGRKNINDTSILLDPRQEVSSGSPQLQRAPKLSAINDIPTAALALRRVAEFVIGKADPASCPESQYAALQDAALNVKGLPDSVATEKIMLKLPNAANPFAVRIRAERCKYFVGLINGTIQPTDQVAAAAIGGEPGLAELTIDDSSNSQKG